MRMSNNARDYCRCVLQATFAVVLLIAAVVANADEQIEANTKTVIQISSGDAATQELVLNNTANLQKELGMDNVEIEIVAFGPGLEMLTINSPFRDRVESMASQNIRFSACENTMAAIERKTGEKPELASGVNTVSSGIARIVELQKQGYTYVRP